MTTYDPFPNIEGTTPLWVNSGNCYSRVLYATQEEAEKVAAVVRAGGGTVNGGYNHGMPLGIITKVHSGLGPDGIGYEVTY